MSPEAWGKSSIFGDVHWNSTFTYKPTFSLHLSSTLASPLFSVRARAVWPSSPALDQVRKQRKLVARRVNIWETHQRKFCPKVLYPLPYHIQPLCSYFGVFLLLSFSYPLMYFISDPGLPLGNRLPSLKGWNVAALLLNLRFIHIFSLTLSPLFSNSPSASLFFKMVWNQRVRTNG